MIGSIARFGIRREVVALLLAAAVGSVASAQSGSADGGAALAKARDERLLLLKAAEFDPLATLPVIPAELTWGADDVADVDYFVVQLASTVMPWDHDELASLGLALGVDIEELDYLAHNAFLVRAPSAALPGLRDWRRARAVLPFEPAYRVDPQLLAQAAAAPRRPLDVAIFLFAGSDAASATLEMREIGVDLFEPDAGARHRLLARLPADRLVALARVRDVQWIQPRSVPTLRNGTTTWVLQSNTSGSTPVWANGVLGDNVIVGHIDDPIYIDSCYFDDPGVPNPGPTHRKIVSHHGSSANPSLHGTHTAGTSAGDQEPINGVITNNGIAYHAKIAHTNLANVTNTNLDSKLLELYNDGARVFTNSWGDDSTTAYNAFCTDIDQFVWDHQDALVCFAVSNLSTITNPENAKNLIAVGASDQAPSQDYLCSGGKGPTTDGRRKPEVFTPGCNIDSADDGQSCGTTGLTGTSMACPAIAAAGALVKQYLEDGYWPSGVPNVADTIAPSAALLKALVLDSAVNMSGISGYPSDQEGWGRLVLDRGLYFSGDSRKTWLVDVPTADGFNAAGETQTHYIHVTGNGVGTDFCLCFTDKHGSLNSSAPVVNDLDLEMVDPNGTLYLGNVFSNGASTTGGSPDPLNNVERVKFAVPVVGWYTVTIRATTIATTRDQAYALVASGDLEPPTPGGILTYGAGTAGSGGFIPALAGSGDSTLGGDVTVTISNGLGGASALLLIGTARASIPFHGGNILVAPPWTLVSLVLTGPKGFAGVGTAAYSGTIDTDPVLVGTFIDVQAVIFDAGGTKGTALTNGVEFTIGS